MKTQFDFQQVKAVFRSAVQFSKQARKLPLRSQALSKLMPTFNTLATLRKRLAR